MGSFIFNQKDIPRDQWRYGLRSSAATGCGWIATYNALHLLGYDAEIPQLIARYERQMPLINGTLGTVFWGPYQCFKSWGFPVKMYFQKEQFDEAARKADASILFFRWKKGAKLGAHFAAVRFNGVQFIGFNTFLSSHSPDALGDSLSDFLRRQKYFGAILITVSKDRKT